MPADDLYTPESMALGLVMLFVGRGSGMPSLSSNEMLALLRVLKYPRSNKAREYRTLTRSL